MMKDAYIVASDAGIGHAEKVAKIISGTKNRTTIFKFNRISGFPNDYKAENDPDNILEKYYLKDENLNAASIVNIQKKELDQIISRISQKGSVFLLEEYIPETFYLKKALFRKRANFFSFGKIIKETELSFNSLSLDIGAKLDFLRKKIDRNSDKSSEFNGHLAIEAPPDSLPYSHLGYFRSPDILTKALISFFHRYYENRNHPPVQLIFPETAMSPYENSGRGKEIKKLLGKRCVHLAGFNEVKKGTTVLTWSTKRYFELLSDGFRPLPATRCGAAFLYKRSEKLEKLIQIDPPESLVSDLFNFYKECSIETIFRI
jgi:hypothetical protein